MRQVVCGYETQLDHEGSDLIDGLSFDRFILFITEKAQKAGDGVFRRSKSEVYIAGILLCSDTFLSLFFFAS